MKKSLKALLIMISILLVAGHSNARFLKKNNLFITPDSLSTVDDSLDSLVDDDTSLQTAAGHMEKNEVGRVQEILNRWSGSSSKGDTNMTSLAFMLSLSVQNIDKMESSASSNKAQGVNSMVTEQRLSTSSNSPGVGHMQIIHHISQPRNVNVMKSHQERSSGRKLGSTPSPGGGH